jgi:uncharacterized protein (DUF924 family)
MRLNQSQLLVFLLFVTVISLKAMAEMSESPKVSITEFAARPLIQRCMANPTNVHSVLSFFYGVDTQDEAGIQAMREGKHLREMVSLWFTAGAEYDALCQSFRETVRNVSSLGWNNSVDEVMARLLCADQLARNIFRGTTEAFQYEAPALDASRTIASMVLSKESCSELPGEVYPPYLQFVITAFLHSEKLADHETALQLLEYVKDNTPSDLRSFWSLVEIAVHDHKRVVDQFGRYPHRNKVHRRENTPEEEAWLADVENLPGWAKSQM